MATAYTWLRWVDAGRPEAPLSLDQFEALTDVGLISECMGCGFVHPVRPHTDKEIEGALAVLAVQAVRPIRAG